MQEINCGIAVIGGGAAGLTAAKTAAEEGIRTVVLDREERPGGVLLQCIHNGFGLHYFHQELTGPEYAERIQDEALKAGAEIRCGVTVAEISETDETGMRVLTAYSARDGVLKIRAKALILAMGCRERCRGNIGTPGVRTAGIYTAGMAQKMINMEGRIPGKEAVIVGSGDIGLIMARRLTWSGMKVKLVTEILDHPSGLSRNIAQCLEDFQIPLRLSTAVTGIHGKDRVESVTVAPLGPDGRPDKTREERIPCDTVLFSVGLIPENDLIRPLGIPLHPVTKGAVVNSRRMTEARNVFACGNVLHVHDLVDFVSLEAEECARGAVAAVRGESFPEEIPVEAGCNLAYTLPMSCPEHETCCFYMRSRILCSKAKLTVTLDGKVLAEKILRNVRPAEMIEFTLPERKENGKKLLFALEELE